MGRVPQRPVTQSLVVQRQHPRLLSGRWRFDSVPGSVKQQHARKVKASDETQVPCSHPLCGDLATYWDIQKPKPLPHCRAHHLEWKYLQHVERNRRRYEPRERTNLHPCGTPAAAARHRRRRELPLKDFCVECNDAENARTRAQKERQREARG